jgi:hypothetical protein
VVCLCGYCCCLTYLFSSFITMITLYTARSLLVLPVLVLLTSFINVYFVLTKGAKKFILVCTGDM